MFVFVYCYFKYFWVKEEYHYTGDEGIQGIKQEYQKKSDNIFYMSEGGIG